MIQTFAPHRRRILVVDDEFINRQMLGFILSTEYDVTYAENGVEALTVLHEDNNYSLVMLDLLMPQMDGFEFLKIRQREEQLRAIPVIVLTSEQEAELKSLKLGAVDFIKKPYDLPEVILARVERVVELTEDRHTILKTERDRLTGLYTMQYFCEYVNQREYYFPNRLMDIGTMNIQGFHIINELYGRDFGDEVLKTLADILQEFLRENGGIACRGETDWFYIYFDHQKDYDSVIARISEELYRRIPRARVRLQLGIYSSQDHDMDIGRRCDRAKLACDSLRGKYEGGVAFYDIQMHENILASQKLINELDEAVFEGQLKVYYQPKYDIRGGEITLAGAEALVRWEHPELGLLSPGAFMPLFEKNGLIRKVDYHIWKTVAFQLREWKDTLGAAFPISVNVSRVDLYDPEIETVLRGILADSQLDVSDLHLEVTESAYVENIGQLKEVVRHLHDGGFCFEMDDFGSGYSSLGMLKNLPVDVLKLDRGLICDIHTDEKSLYLVTMILEMARTLGFAAVAEGVEVAEQYELLRDNGCEMMQGRYFSGPIPADDFEELIKEKTRKAAETEEGKKDADN